MRDFIDKIDNTAPLSSGILTALEDNTRFKELENAVSTSGITLDGAFVADTDVTMLAQSLARYASGGIMCQDGGAANAYVLTSVGNFVMPKAYFRGMMVAYYPAYENTSAATANCFGLGLKKIYDADGISLSGGEILASRLMVLIYDTSLDGGAGGFKMAPWTGIYISKPITKTVHGDGADFVDLFAAVDWLSHRIITRKGSVVFAISAGQYSYSLPIILNHPNLDRVTFRGATLLAAPMTNSTFVVTGTALTLDKSAHLTALRAIYATELRFATSAGYIYSLSKRPTFSQLLITNDGSSPDLGCLLQCEDSLTTSNLSVHGSGDHGIIVRSGMFLVNGPTSASGCSGPGIAISDGAGLVQVGNLHLNSNNSSGLASLGGQARRLLGTLQCCGNGIGLYGFNNGSISLSGTGAILTSNTIALYAHQGGSVGLNGSGAVIADSTHGAYADQGRITARGSNFSANTTAASAFAGSTIDLTGSSGASVTNPANDTIGNNNSLVIVSGGDAISSIVVSPPSQTISGVTVGTPITASQSATGGTAPYTYSVAAGAVPPGYTLSLAGVWSGIVSRAGNYAATIRATDARGNTGSASYTWIITAAAMQVSPPSQVISGVIVGNPVFGSQTAIGGTLPYTWTVASGSLPPGYTLSSGGTWGGTATTAGTYTATIRATDAYSQTGTAVYTWHIVAASSAIVVSPASSTISGIAVGSVGSGTFTASGGTSPYTWAVSAGALPTGYSLSSGGVLSGTSSEAGSFTATIRATDNVAATGFATYTWIISSSTVTVTPASQTVSVAVGSSVFGNQYASGGLDPYIWTVSSGSLPPGYNLSSGGTWSGTATTAGSYTATVRATDTLSSYGSATYIWNIASAPTPPTITVSPGSQTITGIPVGAPVFGTQSASGGVAPYTWSGSAPPGYTLSSGGVWGGTATTAGTYSGTVTATDANGATGSASYTWVIS